MYEMVQIRVQDVQATADDDWLSGRVHLVAVDPCPDVRRRIAFESSRVEETASASRKGPQPGIPLCLCTDHLHCATFSHTCTVAIRITLWQPLFLPFALSTTVRPRYRVPPTGTTDIYLANDLPFQFSILLRHCRACNLLTLTTQPFSRPSLELNCNLSHDSCLATRQRTKTRSQHDTKEAQAFRTRSISPSDSSRVGCPRRCLLRCAD